MLASAKQWFINRYVEHMIASVNSNAERVRQLQSESGMARERVSRFEFFDGDVTLRARVPQKSYPLTLRIHRDGTVERLPNDTRPDVTVFTDIPTVYGIARGEYTMVLPSGARKPYPSFTVWDAVRLGKIEWTGASSALAELMLFEKRIGPEFLEAMRLPELEPSSGR